MKSFEESNNITLDRNEEFLEMIKFMNKLSGKMLIDYLTSSEIRKLLLEEVKKLVENRNK